LHKLNINAGWWKIKNQNPGFWSSEHLIFCILSRDWEATSSSTEGLLLGNFKVTRHVQ
jgi:hypothetical protein